MNTDKQNRFVIGIILSLVVLGIFGLILYQKYLYSSKFFEYNGFSIYEGNKNGLPLYQIKFFINENAQPFVINSRYHPRDLENINVYSGLKEDLIKKEIYITMDPGLSSKATIAFAEIDKYLENPFLFNLPTYPALLNKLDGNDLPTVTCNNVTESKSVIMFKIGEKNDIYNDNGCVILEAINEDELIKVADRLSLTALGVMR